MLGEVVEGGASSHLVWLTGTLGIRHSYLLGRAEKRPGRHSERTITIVTTSQNPNYYILLLRRRMTTSTKLVTTITVEPGGLPRGGVAAATGGCSSSN